MTISFAEKSGVVGVFVEELPKKQIRVAIGGSEPTVFVVTAEVSRTLRTLLELAEQRVARG